MDDNCMLIRNNGHLVVHLLLNNASLDLFSVPACIHTSMLERQVHRLKYPKQRRANSTRQQLCWRLGPLRRSAGLKKDGASSAVSSNESHLVSASYPAKPTCPTSHFASAPLSQKLLLQIHPHKLHQFRSCRHNTLVKSSRPRIKRRQVKFHPQQNLTLAGQPATKL